RPHEDASHEAANGELLMSLGRHLLLGNLGDHCRGRPLMKEGQQFLYSPLGTLSMNQHDAVLTVAHPAHHPELLCPLDGRLAKADTLHLTAYRRPNRSVRGPARPLRHRT